MDERLLELRQKYISPRDHDADAAAIRQVIAAGQEDAVPQDQFETFFDRSHPFLQVGFQQYTQFRSQAESMGIELPWSDVEHGFVSMAAGIAKCTYAYARYLRESSGVFDRAVLTSALTSPRTVSFFVKIAGIPEIANREYETYFSLRGNYATSDTGEFSFDPTEPCFIPDTVREVEAEEEGAVKISELTAAGITEDELGKCPAQRYIPRFWRATVDACLEAGLLDEEAVTCGPHGYRTY